MFSVLRNEMLAVNLFFTALALLFTFPLILHLGSRVAGAYPGDNFHYLWQLWYPGHALFDSHASPLFDPKVYSPFGFDLFRNQDPAPAVILLAMPLTRLFGEVVAYNVSIITSFSLTALGTYLLAKLLWESRAGALLAGVAVGFCEYRIVHATGHLTLTTTQWIPFFFLYLEKCIRKPDLKNGLLCGLFFSLMALSTWYYGLLGALAALFYLAVRVRWKHDLHRLRPFFRAGVAAILVALFLVGPFAFLNFRAQNHPEVASRPLEESQAFSASVADFFIPGIEHPLWRSWLLNHWRKGANGAWLSEWQVYVGFTVLGLGLVGLRSEHRRIVTALAVLAGGSFLLALGPSLYVTHPQSIEGAAHHAPLSNIAMPVSLLAKVPPFTFLRAWARMGFFVQLALALLAAGGLAHLLAWMRKHNKRLAGGILVLGALSLAGFETFSAPYGTASVRPRPADRWLSARQGDFAYMQYPMQNHAFSGPAMYSRRITDKAYVMGYGSFPPNVKYWGTLDGFPSPDSLDLLRKWNVKYVLIDEKAYEPGVQSIGFKTWPPLKAALSDNGNLREVKILDGVHIYLLS